MRKALDGAWFACGAEMQRAQGQRGLKALCEQQFKCGDFENFKKQRGDAAKQRTNRKYSLNQYFWRKDSREMSELRPILMQQTRSVISPW